MGRVEQGGGMLGRQLIIGSRSNLLSWGGVAQSPFVKRGLGMDFWGCLYRCGGGCPDLVCGVRVPPRLLCDTEYVKFHFLEAGFQNPNFPYKTPQDGGFAFQKALGGSFRSRTFYKKIWFLLSTFGIAQTPAIASHWLPYASKRAC